MVASREVIFIHILDTEQKKSILYTKLESDPPQHTLFADHKYDYVLLPLPHTNTEQAWVN
jgi:hypothetical protein